MIGFLSKVQWQAQRTIVDPDGQYLTTQGLLIGKLWTLAGIYTPQQQKGEFFNLLIKDLESFADANLIPIGDINAVMDQKLDKSSIGLPCSEIPLKFRNWMKAKGLIDCWRNHNTHSRDYTFFSNQHNGYSRIDDVFVKHQPSIQIIKAKIDTRTFSDHAAVLVTWLQEEWLEDSKGSWTIIYCLMRK